MIGGLSQIGQASQACDQHEPEDGHEGWFVDTMLLNVKPARIFPSVFAASCLPMASSVALASRKRVSHCDVVHH